MTDNDCQTSAPYLDLTKEDVEDDIVIEAVAEGSYRPSRTNQSRNDDELDVTVKVASGHVVNELKSVLPLQVNAERRQTRKKALFPDYWESRSETTDIILPELSSFSFPVSEVSVISTSQEDDDIVSDEEPLLYDDERQRREGRRDHERLSHAFCCSEQTSLAQLIAKQVAAKSKTLSAQEYLYDVEDSS